NGDRLITENPDGTGLRLVRPSSPIQQSPSFSLECTRMVYKNVIADHVVANAPTQVDIVVADADGSNAKTIVRNVDAGNPLWSPDGRWITYTASGNTGDRAFVVAADGSTPPTDLGDFGGADPWTPSFSPDSSKLAVAVGDGT